MPTSVDHKSTHAHTQPDTHSAHTPIPQRGRSIAKTLLFTSISNNDKGEKAGNSSKPQENPWQSSSICISCAAEPKVHAHSPTHTHTQAHTSLITLARAGEHTHASYDECACDWLDITHTPGWACVCGTRNEKPKNRQTGNWKIIHYERLMEIG